MSGPVNYSLCDQTVTVYRREGKKILRQVVENCYLQAELSQTEDEYGQRRQHRFLLIVPGGEQAVFPGDRVIRGIGPEVNVWQETGDMLQIGYAENFYWQGEFCHTEAGRKR